MKNKLFFLLIFIILGFIALQIPVNQLAGSRVKFTLFDLFAPISGAFLGTPLGIISVLAMQVSNLAVHGFSGVDGSSILKVVVTLRIVPMMFGVWFFAYVISPKASKKILIVPLLSIIIFNLHPVGRTVWVYSMFWLIPFLIWPFCKKSLVARSLGSTFTAHSVGGAIWIWAFNLPANVWLSLIPVTAMERSIFALGISASYILMNNVLAYLSVKRFLPAGISFDKKYTFRFK